MTTIDTLKLYKDLQDLWAEANAVDTIIGRPQVLLNKIAKIRDAVGQVTESNTKPTDKIPYGFVTTHSVTGQQFFYRYPNPPYIDNASECIAVYTVEEF